MAVWLAVAASAALGAANEPAAEDIEFFEKRVRPILVERCFECHASGSAKLRGGLALDHRDGVLKGGDTGPAATPGHPDQSLLIEAIGYESQAIEMPPSGKLPAPEIAILTEWVKRGLPYPATNARSAREANDWETRRTHWAFQPLQTAGLPAPPPREWTSWPDTTTDLHVLAKQAEKQLHPAPPADRRVLLRRLKLDLLGLPPTREELDEFAADAAPDAYARLVDRYLSSPQYGERWGRHWLDLTRYCDVAESWREGIGQPWLYRDWVVSAWNRDLGYDDFVRLQFAADLLPNPLPSDNAALGFLGLSPTYWKELKLDHLVIKQVVAEEWEERIEAISGTFLGLTMACARCHDHKYDPLTMRDYYGMAGVLASIRIADCPTVPEEQAGKARAARTRIKDLEKQVETLTAKKPVPDENQQKAEDLKRQIDQIRRETPELAIPEACGVVDASLQVLPDGPSRTKLEFVEQPQNVALQIRGNAGKTGEMIPRGFPAVFTESQARTFSQGSGRLELAHAIVTDAAPLAARVIVNRIWKHHFGRGIVATTSNFGLQGERPTHPELLDSLASRLIANGWSLKWLQREIVLSATYCQSAFNDSVESDPDNVWLSRMPPKRLDVEAWRDSMLAVTGELDLRMGGPSSDLLEPANRRRTVYGTVKRRELADLLRLHDFPDPVTHVAAREPTTTPLQQLFVLNSPLMRERSLAWLARPDIRALPDRHARLEKLVSEFYGRQITTDERQAMDAFLTAAVKDGANDEAAWTQLVQALLGSNELLFTD